MNALIILLLAAPPVTSKYCHQTWPQAAKPSAAQTDGCIRLFLADAYGKALDEEALSLDPSYGAAYEVKLSIDALTKMAAHAAKDCDATLCGRGQEYFEGMAARKLSLFENVNLGSIEPLLATVLAGQKLAPEALKVGPEALRWSPLTLWRLRNAAYARHGYLFKNPDLNAFFYGARKDSKLLPLPEGKTKKVTLTPIDGANVRLVKTAETGK